MALQAHEESEAVTEHWDLPESEELTEPQGRPENLEGLVSRDHLGTRALLDIKVTLVWRE